MRKYLLVGWLIVLGCLLSVRIQAQETPPLQSEDYSAAIQYLEKEQYDAAIESFQKALREEKNIQAQARIYNFIGLAYLKQGVSITSSIGSFEQAIRLDPQYAEAYFNIASAYASSNQDPVKAVEYFQKTIDVDPTFSRAYFGLGWFRLMQDENPEQALEYFQKTIDKYPEFAEAYYGMGMAYIRLRKPHMALGAVSHLRDLKKDDLAMNLEKAVTEVSPPQEAIQEYSDATEVGLQSQPRKKGGAKSAMKKTTELEFLE